MLASPRRDYAVRQEQEADDATRAEDEGQAPAREDAWENENETGFTGAEEEELRIAKNMVLKLFKY